MAKLTPMMRQFEEAKKAHPGKILLFRMGDFYETFGEDAKVVSKELNITLTSRNSKDSDRIPLAGIPYHALDGHLAKLIKKGYRVAICEQVEDPKKAKGLVKREVVRVVTPGTVLEESVLEADNNNYLMVLAPMKNCFGIAFLDISTGEFVVTDLDGDGRRQKLMGEVARFRPKEVLVPETWHDEELESMLENQGATLSAVEDFAYDPERSEEAIKRQFKILSLDGLGLAQGKAATVAAGVAITYLEETQKSALPGIETLSNYSLADHMIMDASTLRNLEVVHNIRDGSTKHTLFWVLDRTSTPMGSRLLRAWLQRPLLDPVDVNQRLDAVEELATDTFLRGELAEPLDLVRDMERIVARTVSGSANARDLMALKDSLLALPVLKKTLKARNTGLLKDLAKEMGDLTSLAETIEKALIPDPPITIKEGGLIRKGYNKDLDDLKRATTEGKEWIAELQERERKRTGIKSLKVEFNRVFGYYISITRSNLHLAPEEYIRKQTLVNAERFITPELKEKETLILSSEEKRNALEYELFCKLRDKVAKRGGDIKCAAKAIARLDVYISLAEVSVENGYVRPDVDDSGAINIKDGRHPVVERMLEGGFVPNDVGLDVDKERLMVLTGPNMAGKSTYMRQVALITLMAQIGSFVPASSAHVGTVDRIFTRVGAYDDLTRGQSTFMVEMTEVANILNSATPRSLILLDELGRGTSTFDGLSIAWAVTEYIYDPKIVGAKAIFATHYHHLNEISDILDGVVNYNIAVQEKDGEIVFLRKVLKGGTEKSYGIQVARLAGVPDAVVERAKHVLHKLEEENVLEVKRHVAKKKQATLGVFGNPPEEHEIVKDLKDLEVNAVTPLEALNILHFLKRKAEDDGDKAS